MKQVRKCGIRTARKKIALVSEFTPPYFGGMENHAMEFFRFWRNLPGYEFSKFILMFPYDGSLADAVSFHPILKEKSGDIDEIPYDSIKDIGFLAERIRGMGLENGLIFFNSMHWIRIFPELRRMFPKLGIVMRSGGNDLPMANLPDKGDALEQRQQYAVKSINNGLSALIVNSEYSSGRFGKLGVDPKLMRVVRGGVDTKRFRPIDESEKSKKKSGLGFAGVPIVLSAVRFVQFKAIPCTIDAIAILKESLKRRFIFLLVGDGPLKMDMERRVKERHLEDTALFLGAVPFFSIHELFSISDVYVQTPTYFPQQVKGGSYIHTETMGRTFCEAASAGIPSVSTRVGGVPEIVSDGITGHLVEDGDPEAVAKAIDTLISLGPNNRFSAASRSLALEQFSWERVFGTYQKIFGEF